MSYLGDYPSTATIYDGFSTVSTAGVPTTLAGTPKLRVYKSGSTTESSDITPTVDFDSRTGLVQYSIDLTGDSGFYTTGKDYQVVITAGTVGGVSVVGVVVAKFSIQNRSTELIYAAVDTEVAAILAAVDTEVAAIKTNTDKMVFTVANQLDVNVHGVHDVNVVGNGRSIPWGPA